MTDPMRSKARQRWRDIVAKLHQQGLYPPESSEVLTRLQEVAAEDYVLEERRKTQIQAYRIELKNGKRRN
jgi:hypothetical protein